MSELTAKRWEKTSQNPASHPVVEALEVALHRLRTGEYEAEHVIICMGMTNAEGGGRTTYTQAGTFNGFAQAGLLQAVSKLILAED